MSLPLQRIPLSKKGKQWKKDVIDYYEKLSYGEGSSNRSSNYSKKVNYDLYNGRFNKADLQYVCDPLGVGENEYPATLQHYDIVSPAINLLVGEEATRPDNCVVISESPTDINRKQQSTIDRIKMSLQRYLMAEIDPSTIDPNNPPPTPEQILKYDKYNLSDLTESKANKMHKHLKRYLNTKEVFKKGWKDVMCAGEEIYWTGVSGNEVIFRRCNPLNTVVILDGDTDYIDDAIAVVETRMLSASTILDEFGDDLSEDDVRKLEEFSHRYNTSTGNFNSDPVFTLTSNGVEDTGVSGFSSTSTTGSIYSDLIRVVRVEWKSFKKLYYLSYTDEDGVPQSITVDESFDIKIFRQVYPDAITKEYWVNEAWEGLKANDDIYFGIRPKPNQRRRMDNPYYCKLGYTGLIYNSTNSRSISLMDRLKPYQYLYNIISYRLELAFASDIGKIFLMDLAQIPRSEGIDIERWMYYLKAMKIAFINSFEEGHKGQATGQFASSKFNQFQSVDLTLSNTIQQYIQTLDYIKQQTAFISGVTPQRLGAINSQELVGNVERSVQQSALITEYLFDSHDEVKRRCYVALIECAKIAYRGGKKIQYILDDMGIELLSLEEGEFDDSELNVFMSSATKDNKIINEAKEIFKLAIANDKIDMSTIVDSLINDSPRDILHTIKRSEQDRQAREKALADQQAQLQQSAIDAQKAAAEQALADKQLDRELKQYEIDSNNETKIMVAEINALTSKEGPSDMDGDGIPDPIEVAKVSLEERDLASRSYLERDKIKHDKEKSEREATIKEREMALKKEVEDKKIDAIKVQNESQERMQKVQMQNELKKIDAEKEMHAKELKLKEEELKLKSREVDKKVEIEKIKLAAAKQKAAADAKKAQIDIKKKQQAAKKAAQPKKPKKP